MDTLTAAEHKAAEALYRQQSQGGAAPGAEPGAGPAPGGDKSGSPGGDVIDAEVVDEDKK
jgi:hypothetical protein